MIHLIGRGHDRLFADTLEIRPKIPAFHHVTPLARCWLPVLPVNPVITPTVSLAVLNAEKARKVKNVSKNVQILKNVKSHLSLIFIFQPFYTDEFFN